MRRLVAKISALAAETRRRNVYKVAAVYAVTAWGASMGASSLFPAFDAPGWAVKVFVLLAALGFPIVVVLAWAYEITPDGIVRDGASRPDALPAGGAPAELPATAFDGKQGTVLVAWQASGTRHEKTFAGDFRFGRDTSCEVRFDDPMVSRRHAEVSCVDGTWWIADLGSRNGTLVDGKPVSRVRLPVRCTLRLYDAGPTIILETRASPTAPTAVASNGNASASQAAD